MSAFGIGTNTQTTNAGIIRGEQIEIACACWFTTKGKSKPIFFKVEDDKGVIQTLYNLHIWYIEHKNYCGIPSIEYSCSFILGGTETHAKIIYFKDTDKWILNLT